MNTVLEWYRNGGPVMNAILLVAVDRPRRVPGALLHDRHSSRRSTAARSSSGSSSSCAPARSEDAIKLCAQSKAALPDMGLLILRSRSRDESDLQNVADAAALAVIPRLTRRLQYLPMLANVATLLGLLGTIFGLREAFPSVALAAAAERSEQLASGIAIALNATGFGLLIAVPLSVAHAYLVSQAETIIEQVDEFSVRLINALIDRPDVRLGHR